MPHIVKWGTLLTTFLLFAGPLPAGLMITMEPTDPLDLDSSVAVSFSGSGTITAGGSGSALDFLNFDANVFDLLADGSNDFAMDIVFSGFDASALSNYTQTFQTLRLTDQSSGDDIVLRDRTDSGFSFDIDDTYSVSGTATLANLRFRDLLAGTYEASLTSGDGAKFGGASLNIATVATVPEPSSFACFSVLIVGAVVCRRLRRRTGTV